MRDSEDRMEKTPPLVLVDKKVDNNIEEEIHMDTLNVDERLPHDLNPLPVEQIVSGNDTFSEDCKATNKTAVSPTRVEISKKPPLE